MKFLAVTDLHYSDRPQPDYSDREHQKSLIKLGYAVSNYSGDCDFIMDLGDTADSFDGYREQRELLCEVCGVLKSSGKPFYSIIGNHDTATDKREVCRIMSQQGRYYSFECGGYLCAVIDACINDVEKPYPDSEIEWDNCHVDSEQLRWLEAVLCAADKPVLIFSHNPLMLVEWETENPHLVKNRAELIKIIEKSGKVKAIFSGHYHCGCIGVRNGIPHIVFGSMCIEKNNTFAVVDICDERLTVEGFGLNKSFEYIY